MKFTLEQAEDEYGMLPNVYVGDTVVHGAWTITITAEGKACDCGKGVFCPLNPQERTRTSRKTKVCNICKSIRVPIGVHACSVCE